MQGMHSFYIMNYLHKVYVCELCIYSVPLQMNCHPLQVASVALGTQHPVLQWDKILFLSVGRFRERPAGFTTSGNKDGDVTQDAVFSSFMVLVKAVLSLLTVTQPGSSAVNLK